MTKTICHGFTTSAGMLIITVAIAATTAAATTSIFTAPRAPITGASSSCIAARGPHDWDCQMCKTSDTSSVDLLTRLVRNKIEGDGLRRLRITLRFAGISMLLTAGPIATRSRVARAAKGRPRCGRREAAAGGSDAERQEGDEVGGGEGRG